MLKRCLVLVFLCSSLSVITADEFRLWCRFTSDDPLLTLASEDMRLHREQATPYLAVRVYPTGGKSHLSKLLFESTNPFPGEKRSFSFVPTGGKHLLFLFDALGEIHSSSDTYCCFVIRPSENATGRFALRVWNYSKKANLEQALRVTPGQWQLCKIKLNGPGFLEDGDLFKGLSIIHTDGDTARNWQLDKIAIWQGNPPPPGDVKDFQSENHDEENHLYWQSAQGDIPVHQYLIYRGTVPNFIPGPENLLAKVTGCSYKDRQLMQQKYFYRICAEDCNGTRGPLSLPVFAETEP